MKKKIAKVKRKKVESVDWFDIEEAVKDNTGKDLRDWAGDGEYSGSQDFWMIMCDSGMMPGNDSACEIDFGEWLQDVKENCTKECDWIVEPLQAIVDVVGKGSVMVNFSW